MAYVPPFKSDVFVSYAHDDNDPLPGTDGWVDTLVACLRKLVPRQLRIRKEDFKLWFDTAEVAGNRPLAQQLLDAASQSAIMVLVSSENYLNSEWCDRERCQFLALVQAHTQSSIFIVHLEHVAREAQREELRGLTGYRFWMLDDRGKEHTVGYPQPDKEFYAAALELGDAIAEELKSQRNRALPPTPPAAVAGPARVGIQPPLVVAGLGKTIYLAETTDDLDQRRNGVRSYLEQLGAVVVPTQDYPPEPHAFDTAVRADLAKSSIFVQLVSAVPGKRPPGLPQGYAARQLELAQETRIPILRWRDPELVVGGVEDEAQRAFLQGAKVRAEGIEDFKRELKRLLLEKERIMARPANAFFFINFDAADRSLAQELSDIVRTCGGDFAFPANGPDASENRRGLQEYLTACDAMIIVYGKTEPSWVKSQLLECRKSTANRAKPLKALAVLEGPPEQKNPLDIYVRPMVTLNARAHLDRPAIEAFVRSTMLAD